MVDGIVYGEDPRQGYVEGGVFYHPELKFSFPVPSNWQLLNSPTQVQMAPSNGKALMIFTLGEGSSLQDAANSVNQQLQLTVSSSRQVTVNGLQGLEVIAQQISQNPNTGEQSAIAIKSLYIKYGTNIYLFHSVSTPSDFQSYASQFDKTMYGFKSLSDASKINVKPERIQVVSVKNNGTLASALQAYGIPSTRNKELAILNGMTTDQAVTAGSKIKIVQK
jgi:predicted Zn-dependent protease